MINSEILTKAIQKAIDGGWKPNDRLAVYIKQIEEGGWIVPIRQLIYEHSFAKALWSNQYHKTQTGLLNAREWEHHLQQMVIADDPIKYLGDHI